SRAVYQPRADRSGAGIVRSCRRISVMSSVAWASCPCAESKHGQDASRLGCDMAEAALKSLGIHSISSGAAIGGSWRKTTGKPLKVTSPIDRAHVATVNEATAVDVDAVINEAAEAFKQWRIVPAPRRGELVRRVGMKLRERKSDL